MADEELTQSAELHFDPAEHRYWLDERELPSVSRILVDMGFYRPPMMALEYHRLRGQRIHECCAAIDTGDWDRESTGAVIRPYAEAYAKFCDRWGFTAQRVEQPVHSQLYSYAGTLDRCGTIQDGRRILIDIKSGDPPPSVEIQMALYEFAAKESLGIEVDECWAVWLRDDASFKREPSTDPCALSLGLGAVAGWHWRAKHGLLAA